MSDMDTKAPVHGSRMRIPRSRGAASGFLLILLGAWGALIPFVGPYFDFAWGSDQEWMWTAARGWLEVLPGAATVFGGLLLLTSRNRANAMFGGWITVLAGAWFVVGRPLADVLRIGDLGRPLASADAKFALLDLTYFSGLGALIVFLGALALGRLSVRSLRDIHYAQDSATTESAAPAPTPEATADRAESEQPDRAESEEPDRAESEEPVDEGPEPPEPEKAHRRSVGGLFRRHRETTTASR